MKKVVITGASGSGKTTLITALQYRGYPIVPEAARMVVANYNVDPGSKRQKLIFNTQIALERHVCKELTFLDRSILDGLVYARFYKATFPNPNEYLQRASYYSTVFLLSLPPISTHPKREETYEESLSIESMLSKEYINRGFRVFEIPFLPLVQRIKEIESELQCSS